MKDYMRYDEPDAFGASDANGKRGPRVGSIHNNYAIGALTDDHLLAAELLSTYLPDYLSEAIDWEKIDAEKTSFVDETLRNSFLDVAFSAPYKGGGGRQRFLIVIEHKSNIDRRVPLQLLSYCAQTAVNYHSNGLDLPDGRSPWPLPVLLYNGAKEWKNLPTMRDAVGAWKGSPCAEEYERVFVPLFNYWAIDLASYQIEDFRGGAMVRTFFEVLKRGTDGTLLDALVASRLPWNRDGFIWDDYSEARLSRFYRRTVSYVDGVARNSGTRIDEEKYNHTVETAKDTRVKGTMKTFIDDFIEKGYVKGRSEGVLIGQTDSIYNSIERYLTIRFKELPLRLKEKIESINDYPSLEEIQIFIWKCNSLNEIEAFVDRTIDSLKER